MKESRRIWTIVLATRCGCSREIEWTAWGGALPPREFYIPLSRGNYPSVMSDTPVEDLPWDCGHRTFLLDRTSSTSGVAFYLEGE